MPLVLDIPSLDSHSDSKEDLSVHDIVPGVLCLGSSNTFVF